MHDNEWQQPDWDADDYSHRAGLDARLADILTQHLDNDPLWPTTVTGLADDLTRDDQVREMLARVCILVENMAIWCHGGRQEALDAFRADRAQLRRIAMEGAGS